MPASVIFREGKKGKHFEDSDPFLLHTVRGSKAEPFKFKLTREQSLLRKKIYSGKATPTHLYNRYGGSVTYSPFAHPPVKKMGAWKDWSAYKAIEQMVHSKSTLDPKCDNICQNYLRQGYMGMTLG